MKLLLSRAWSTVYDGEDAAAKAAAEKAAAEKAAAEQGVEGTDADGNPIFKQGTLTQQQFNYEMAKQRKQFKERTEKTIAELENLKKAKGLTDTEKDKLQGQITELQTTIQTKEQLLENEKRRLANEHKTAVENETKQKDLWKSRFERQTIERAILDAASANDGYNPLQFIHQLVADTRLVEESDGKFTPKVKFNDIDKEGKPIVLDLTPVEAVKRMKELPELYGNFFKANVSGGLGGRQSGDTTRPVDVTKLTPEQYQEWRKANGLTKVKVTR